MRRDREGQKACADVSCSQCISHGSIWRLQFLITTPPVSLATAGAGEKDPLLGVNVGIGPLMRKYHQAHVRKMGLGGGSRVHLREKRDPVPPLVRRRTR